MYADLMQFRISCSNRATRGGMDPAVFESLLGSLEHQETALARALRSEYRRVVSPSIRTWQSSTIGLGEHTFARLIGILGHPRIARPMHWEGTGKARA